MRLAEGRQCGSHHRHPGAERKPATATRVVALTDALAVGSGVRPASCVRFTFADRADVTVIDSPSSHLSLRRPCVSYVSPPYFVARRVLCISSRSRSALLSQDVLRRLWLWSKPIQEFCQWVHGAILTSLGRVIKISPRVVGCGRTRTSIGSCRVVSPAWLDHRSAQTARGFHRPAAPVRRQRPSRCS